MEVAYFSIGSVGLMPASSVAPAFTHASILAIEASDSVLIAVCGIRGVSSPLIRKTRWLSSGLPGSITLWPATPATVWVPSISFWKVDMSSLRARAGPFLPS